MHADSRIYIAGHTGLVGSAIRRRLQAGGYRNVILRRHGELDLTDQEAVRRFFRSERPEYVFLAAAKVGGIFANNTFPAEFIYQNLAIQTSVIHSAYEQGAKRLLFLGSSCIYPKLSPQPIKEEYLLTGALEPTNEPYAIAKIAGIEMCSAYNRQYGTDFISVMPTNIFGPGDNYDLRNSHVIPALIRKTHEAKMQGSPEVVVWGTGRPRREFLYSEDLADACVFLAEKANKGDVAGWINVGTGADVSIGETVQLVADVVGFVGRIRYDESMPDGAPRKLLDVSKLTALGWQAKTGLREGIQKTYADFLQQVSANH
jgi:GDP-L-fucose synthase